MEILQRHPRETGRDYAFRTIKHNIINLQLAPGSQVSENELAAELGLSRTPVREAIIELAKVKIIDVYPQKRSTVAMIDYDLVEEACFLRNLLERGIVELVCSMATESDILRLRENVRLQNYYLDNFEPEALQMMDDKFHQTLFEIAKKMQTYTLLQNVSIHFDRVRSMSLFSVKKLMIVQDHENIVEAIARKDKAEAVRLIDIHLNRYKTDESAIREQYPQYFKKT